MEYILFNIPGIGWVAVDLGTLGHLVSRPDSDHLPSVHHYLVNLFVQHVSSSIDGRQTGKSLGKFSKPVQRIQIRRLAISKRCCI